MLTRTPERLNEPRDAASLAAFRVLSGLVMLGGVIRYFASGGVDRVCVDLAQVEDGLAAADWILPAPEGPLIRLRSYRESVAAR
jgi:hypothetical protein